MKNEMQYRMYGAQLKWFRLKEKGWTKHELKMEGIREKGDMIYGIRDIIFMGSTRVAYEKELKKFLEYALNVRGKTDNNKINKNDFRAYMRARMADGGAKKELD